MTEYDIMLDVTVKVTKQDDINKGKLEHMN